MTKKYTNLKEYLNDKCYDLLIHKAKGLIFGNLDRFALTSEYIPYSTEREIEDVAITSLYTEAGKNDEVFIYCNAYADVVFYGFAYGKRRNDVDSDSKRIWLSVTFKSNFTDKFENLKIIEIQSIDEKRPFDVNKCSTKSFIPYMSEKSLDYHASEFLKKYCPQALQMPMPLPIGTIIQQMGLKVKVVNLKQGTFGRCYFADKEFKKKDGTKEVLKRGTILCNRDAFFLSGIGSINNTIIHECVHWEYHRRFFALMRLLDSSLSAIECTTLEDEIQGNVKNTEEFRWMEWQANALAPRILMPAEMMKLKYSEIKSEITSLGETNVCEIYKQTINRLATFFNVTITSVKIRLIELGCDYLKGIHDYVDNAPTKSHLFKSEAIKSNQVFSAGLYDSVASSVINNDLRNCLEARTIVYADGFFVINNKKYTVKNPITRKQELTEYALEHMDECCLVFDVEPKKNHSFNDKYYSMCFLCRNQSSQESYTRTVKKNDHNDDVYKKSLILCDAIDDNKEALEIIKNLNGDFKDMLQYLMSMNNMSNRELSKQTGINDHKIAAFIKGTSNPTKYELIAIIGGLNLHPLVANHFMRESGYCLTNTERDATYYFLINHHYEEGLDEWNEKLKSAGFVDWQLP